jgi:phosphate starvation-inducible membrane PsiE
MDPQPYKRVFTRILDAFEPIAYLTIAFALSVPIVMLIVSAAMTMLEVAHLGVLETVLAVLDRLLLAFIFVELIATIKITQTERGIFIAEPFLLVGLIAAVRRILLLTAGLEQAESMEKFQNMVIELGVMTGLVIVLTIALYFTRRMRLSDPTLS